MSKSSTISEIDKLAQIKSEYEEGRSFLENKKLRWVDQLKLLSNLQREDQNISSTMLFTSINRVHSSLYEPKIQIKFEPNQEGEMTNVEMLNKLATSDFQEMDMSVIEYDWLWDSVFFGRGYTETITFNKFRKLMQPTVLNPLAFYYDPLFEEVQEWRYYGKWISRSSNQLQYLIKEKVITGINSPAKITSGMDPEVWNYKVLREVARYVTPQGPDSGVPTTTIGNDIYQILEHYTYFGGVKTCVWCDRDITKILREEPLELNDNPERKDESKWPIVDRVLFREPHSSSPISVPDLIEDKHRAKNVILNLAYIAAKDEATPIYVAVEDDIENPSQLLQRQINQHILVKEGKDPNNVVVPLRKSPGLSNSTLSLLSILGNEGADAIGTTQITPPVTKGKKTATGDALSQMVADLVGSLQSRIIGNSEKEFWSHWYQRYVNNAKEGDYKIVSVTNSQFTTFEQIQLTKLKTEFPPKVICFSARDAEFKEATERRELAQQLGTLQSLLSPEEMKMFLKFIWLPKFQTFDRETVDLIIPKSQDELKAEMENEMLAKGILPPISEGDNHEVHLYIHSRVKNTAHKWAHYFAHQKLLANQKKQQATQQDMQQKQQQNNPEPNTQQEQNAPGKNTQGKAGKQKSKSMLPEEAAVPAKGNMAGVDKQITNSKQMA